MTSKKPTKEENAIILDYLKFGYINPNRPTARGKPIAQAIGTEKFKLLELTPKKGIDLDIQDKVYIGAGKREKVNRVKGVLKFENLTATSRIEIEYTIKDIIKSNEKKFLKYFNEASNPNNKLHKLDLIEGIDRKTMFKIHDECKKEAFKDFNDLNKRVSSIKNPVEIITKRVIFELDSTKKDKGNKKFYFFTQKNN